MSDKMPMAEKILRSTRQRSRSLAGYLENTAKHSLPEYINDMRSFSIRDFFVFAKYWLLISWCMLKVGLKRGPGFIGEIRHYPWILQLLKVTHLMRRISRGRSGRYLETTCMTVYSIVLGFSEQLEGLFYDRDRLIMSDIMVTPEIAAAMGLKVWPLGGMGILLPLVTPEGDLRYIDEAENAGMNPDSCSLSKATLGLFLQGHAPRGVPVVCSNMPCDANMTLYSRVQQDCGAPVYRLDAPFDLYSKRAQELFAEDLKGMIAFLEENTPGRMDWDRLQQICEARNRMMELELELWEMLRLRPAPLAAEAVYLSHLWHFNTFTGREASIRHYQNLVDLATRNIAEGIPASKNERFRAGLWNPPFAHYVDIFNQVERKYGIMLINDSMSYSHYPFIDTSTPDSMLQTLGRTMLEGPMVRHTRGPGVNYIDDAFVMYDHFDLDMLWVAGHVGCKTSQAMMGILREKCREKKISLLVLDYDLMDPRIVSHDEMMKQVDSFMENVMKTPRLDQ
jgi:2-hydroxyglutaryl-CoA dehydratase, D-component